MEVAQIGSGICEHLKKHYKNNDKYIKWIPSLYLIEAICLTHDIGHPPFGHGGEVALNYCMSDCGGFEGNAQTLRIISKLGEYSPEHGFDLTRRTMLGILKYPCFYSKVNANSDSLETNGLNLDNCQKPPKCIFDEESDVLEWILALFSDTDKEKFQEFKEGEPGEHHKSKHKSFDTSIMDLADDIAFGILKCNEAILNNLLIGKLNFYFDKKFDLRDY